MKGNSDFGVVNDIQRMCMNDGPGYRTVVFLKGCFLNCDWCHNPEGKRCFPEVIPFVGNCTGCKECLEVCPTGALGFDRNLNPRIDRGLCSTCLQCVKVCEENALVCWGKIKSVEEVMIEVEEDKLFYANSGGGITVSGGEPMVQAQFVASLFSRARDLEIGTALDTCGHAPWADFESVLDKTDLVLFDLKHMDSIRHKAYAGIGNELILENAKKIAAMGIKMRIRVPIIPRCNDTKTNWEDTARFISGLGDALQGVDLLPYHPFAGGKYKAFGMNYPFPTGEGLEDKLIMPVVNIFLDHAPEVTVGG